MDYFSSDLSLGEIIQITNQMTKSLCFIEDEEKKIICTGFLCKIIYQTKPFYCLMTNDKIINENYLKNKDDIILYFNETNEMERIALNNNKITYFNNKYGISIIEINKEDDISFNDFFVLDSDILKKYLKNDGSSDSSIEDEEKKYLVYIPYYKQNKNIFVSFGKIEEINNEIIDFCNTNKNINELLGAPILDLENKKIIGIFSNEKKEKGGIFGIFLDLILKDFIENNLKKPKIVQTINKVINANKIFQIFNMKSRIALKLNLPNELIGQSVYILNNYTDFSNEELNEDNIELEINGEKTSFCKSFIPKINKNEIIIKFKNNITNCSYMFYNCSNIDEIDLSKFKSKTVNNMEKMFSFCTNLKILDLSSLNTDNVKNMEYMFFMCSNLEYIKIKNLGNKETKMNNIFFNCDNLKAIDLTSYDQFSYFDIRYLLKHIDIDKLEKIVVKKEFKKRFFLKFFVKDELSDRNLLKDFEKKVKEI